MSENEITLETIEEDYQRLKDDVLSLVPADTNTAFLVDTMMDAIEANFSIIKSTLDNAINKKK